MAIDFGSAMLGLSPTRPIDLGGGGGGMERERLRLMREQFEQSKKEHEEELQLRQLEEQGRNAREKLRGEQEKAAKTQADRMAAYKSFTEANASGDIEGARAMIPMMSALGMGVDLEGEDGGLPRYRIEMDAQEAGKREGARAAQASPWGPNETAEQSLDRMGALGYPEDDTGQMLQPGIASSGEIGPDGLSVAERVASTYGEPGEKTPMAAPAEPDYTGGVPKNVLDMGAINSQTMARLNPAMAGIIGGLPEEYQGSAMSTASGIGGLGLPAGKALETFTKAQGDANSLIQDRLHASEKQREMGHDDSLARSKEDFDRYKAGFDTLGKEVAGKYAIESRLRTRSLNKQAIDVLSNSTPEDDMLVLSLISRGFGERGATTEGDVARALGLPATSTWDQITGWVSSRMSGGMPPKNKKALIGVLKGSITANDTEIGTFSDRLLELADDPETDPSVARGVRDYWRATVPKDIRDARQPKAGRADSGDGTIQTGEVVIPESSRIAKIHNNPGNLKFAGQEGASEGEPAQDGGVWAKFDSPEAGLQALLGQIEKDAGRGITLREFITKYAPPQSNDTETYIKQAATSLRATADDLLSEVDPYDVLRFVANKESGTKLPSQYKDDDGEAMADQAEAEGDGDADESDALVRESESALAADAAEEDPADARRRRIAELRAKRGR